MSANTNKSPAGGSTTGRLVMQSLVGAAMGAGSVVLLMEFGLKPMAGITASHMAAGGIGLVYLMIGMLVGMGVVVPSVGSRLLHVEDAQELREERRALIVGSLALGGIGLAMISLVLSGADGIVSSQTGALLAIALLAAITVAGFLARDVTDEMNEAIGRDALYAAYNLLFVVGGGWTILAHGGLAPAPLDWLSMLAGFALLAIFWQVHRRGLARPRGVAQA